VLPAREAARASSGGAAWLPPGGYTASTPDASRGALQAAAPGRDTYKKQQPDTKEGATGQAGGRRGAAGIDRARDARNLTPLQVGQRGGGGGALGEGVKEGEGTGSRE